MTTPAPSPSDPAREITATRIFPAPRELVWAAMTDPQHIVNWWGPRGFTTTIETMDVRPGGIWKHTMHGPDGTAYPNESVFQEVVKPERVVYVHGGRRQGGPGVNFVATWTFEEITPQQTQLTVRMVFPSAEERDFVAREFGAVEGAQQTLERLSEHLPAMRTKPFVISREFAAPRARVWQAWTERESLMRWFGPKGFTMSQAELDLRPGGTFHYAMRTPDDMEMWAKFVYREIAPSEKLVWVNSFSDPEGGVTRHPFSEDPWPLEMLTVVTFAEAAGRTTVTVSWLPLDAPEEERRVFDANHPSMQIGWSGTMEQLDTFLAARAEAG